MTKRPTVVLSCSVLSDLLGKRLPEGMPVTWMDITLHNTPKKLAAALQERIDAIAEPFAESLSSVKTMCVWCGRS